MTIVYVLDVQNRNRDISEVMQMYGVNAVNPKEMKDALKRGKWKVV